MRFVAFCREFIMGARELSAPAKWFWAVVLFVLPLIGLTVAQFITWLRTDVILNPWSFALLFPPIIWLAARAGTAIERTTGPIIWMGKMEPDDRFSMFELEVKNRGSDSVFARIYAVRLEDRKGGRLRNIGKEIELHWRDHKPEDRILLYGNKREFAGIFQAVTEWDGKPIEPTVCVTAPGDPGTSGYKILQMGDPSIPLRKREEIWLTIRIDFNEKKENGLEGNCIKTREKRFAIIPDSKSKMYFRVRPVRRIRWPAFLKRRHPAA